MLFIKKSQSVGDNLEMTQMIELVDRDSKIFSMWSGSYNKY